MSIHEDPNVEAYLADSYNAVVPLFEPERVKRHLISYNCGQSYRSAVTVLGIDGVARVVERSQPLTGIQIQALLRTAIADAPVVR